MHRAATRDGPKKTNCPIGNNIQEKGGQVVKLSRRNFLKLSGTTTAGVALYGSLAHSQSKSASAAGDFSLNKQIGETTTICCYCAVGCGAIASADSTKIINIEGDPDHPINQGTLCSKGSALAQMRTVDGKDNPRRLTTPRYRRSKEAEWEDIDWDTAINKIATKIKNTRDTNWISRIKQNTSGNWTSTEETGADTYAVSRTDAIANFGGGELDNEECYLLVKMCRALGLVYVEHCARI